ncbi:hypothetical protein ABT329_24080, partial [Streptomyces minutiscleroticus]
DFDSDDLELTEQVLSKAYTRMRIGSDGGPTRVSALDHAETEGAQSVSDGTPDEPSLPPRPREVS